MKNVVNRNFRKVAEGCRRKRMRGVYGQNAKTFFFFFFYKHVFIRILIRVVYYATMLNAIGLDNVV